jgi:hypothetical protein
MIGNFLSTKVTYSRHSSNWSAINFLPKLTILVSAPETERKRMVIVTLLSVAFRLKKKTEQ